jgi:hypothetical protein
MILKQNKKLLHKKENYTMFITELMNWEKVFASLTSDNGLIFKVT